MDDGLLNKPNDSTSKNEVQDKMDEALDKLPDDLEKPIGPPPFVGQPPSSETKKEGLKSEDKKPVEPDPLLTKMKTKPVTSSSMADSSELPASVVVEKPEEIESSGGVKKISKKTKKKITKVVGGLVMVLLVVGGLFMGKQAVQERQVIEKDAHHSDGGSGDGGGSDGGDGGSGGSWQLGDVRIQGQTMYVKTESGVKSINIGGTAFYREMQLQGDTNIEFNLHDVDRWVNNKGNVSEHTPGLASLIETTEGTNLRELIENGLKPITSKSDISDPKPTDKVDLWLGSDTNGDGKIDGKDGAAYYRVNYEHALAMILAFGSGQIDQGDGSQWNQVFLGECTGNACVGGDGGDGGDGGETHMACDSNNACVSVSGAGADECSSSADCVTTVDYSCESLESTPSASIINLDDTVRFTCAGANFSSASPVAYFRYSIDGVVQATEISPAIALDANGKAAHDITIDQAGDWLVQCKVCTDNTEADCTEWGKAN